MQKSYDFGQKKDSLMRMRPVIFGIVFFFSCHTQESNKDEQQKELKPNQNFSVHEKADSVNTSNLDLFSFIDRVEKKSELSITQIKNYTSIDSVYYTGIYSDVRFTGDTVFNSQPGVKGVIVDYDDRRSCIYKFLLVINENKKNVATKLIYSECDRDESADYLMLRYNILNDSIFETIETYFPVRVNRKEIKKIKWKINKFGEIDSLQ